MSVKVAVVTRQRIVVAHCVADVLRSLHRRYFEDLPFAEAVEFIMILNAIYCAEANSSLFDKTGLAAHLGIPRETLRRKLAMLESRVLIRLDHGRLRLDEATVKTRKADKALRQLANIIIDAGKQLAKLSG